MKEKIHPAYKELLCNPPKEYEYDNKEKEYKKAMSRHRNYTLSSSYKEWKTQQEGFERWKREGNH